MLLQEAGLNVEQAFTVVQDIRAMAAENLIARFEASVERLGAKLDAAVEEQKAWRTAQSTEQKAWRAAQSTWLDSLKYRITVLTWVFAISLAIAGVLSGLLVQF